MVTSPLIKRMSAVFGVYVRRPINTDTILMESTRFLLLAPLKNLLPGLFAFLNCISALLLQSELDN